MTKPLEALTKLANALRKKRDSRRSFSVNTLSTDASRLRDEAVQEAVCETLSEVADAIECVVEECEKEEARRIRERVKYVQL